MEQLQQSDDTTEQYWNIDVTNEAYQQELF